MMLESKLHVWNSKNHFATWYMDIILSRYDDGVSNWNDVWASVSPLLPVFPHVTDEANSCSELTTIVITSKGSCIWGLGCRDMLTYQWFFRLVFMYAVWKFFFSMIVGSYVTICTGGAEWQCFAVYSPDVVFHQWWRESTCRVTQSPKEVAVCHSVSTWPPVCWLVHVLSYLIILITFILIK